MESLYGWQLLYASIEPKIYKKSDLLIALLHFLISKEYNLRNIECSKLPKHGQSKLQLEGSELLPANWNRDAEKYALHYIGNDQRYVLMAKLTRDDLVINLQNWTTKRMSIACVSPEELVHSLHGKLKECMPTVLDIMQHLRDNLIEPVLQGNKGKTLSVAQQMLSAETDSATSSLGFGHVLDSEEGSLE